MKQPHLSPKIPNHGRSGWNRRGFSFVQLIVVLLLMGLGVEAQVTAFKVDRFEADIRRFESRDATNPPVSGAVVFTGSSSVVKWSSLSNDFAGIPVLNRGFGGSTWRELNHYFPRLLLRCQPRAVMVYEGDNDLAIGRSVGECLADFEIFRELMRQHLPGIPVAILAVKPSASREKLRADQNRLNAEIGKRLDGQANWVVLDVATVVTDGSGEPLPNLFEKDRLHLNAEGYARWVPVVRPWVEKFGGP